MSSGQFSAQAINEYTQLLSLGIVLMPDAYIITEATDVNKTDTDV